MSKKTNNKKKEKKKAKLTLKRICPCNYCIWGNTDSGVAIICSRNCVGESCFKHK